MLLNSFLPLRRKTTAAYPWLISKALLFSHSHMGDGSGSLNATASLEAGKMQTGSDTQQECCMTSACSSLAYRTRNTARFKATTGTTYYDAHDYSSCLAARQNSHRQSKSLVCMSLDSPVMHTQKQGEEQHPPWCHMYTHTGSKACPLWHLRKERWLMCEVHYLSLSRTHLC